MEKATRRNHSTPGGNDLPARCGRIRHPHRIREQPFKRTSASLRSNSSNVRIDRRFNGSTPDRKLSDVFHNCISEVTIDGVIFTDSGPRSDLSCPCSIKTHSCSFNVRINRKSLASAPNGMKNGNGAARSEFERAVIWNSLRATDRCATQAGRSNPGISANRKGIDSSPGRRVCSGRKKR